MLSLYGLYEQQTNYLRLRKLISTKKHSVGKGSTDKSFTGISSLAYNKIPPPLQFFYCKRIAKAFYLKLTFWKTVINFSF